MFFDILQFLQHFTSASLDRCLGRESRIIAALRLSIVCNPLRLPYAIDFMHLLLFACSQFLLRSSTTCMLFQEEKDIIASRLNDDTMPCFRDLVL